MATRYCSAAAVQCDVEKQILHVSVKVGANKDSRHTSTPHVLQVTYFDSIALQQEVLGDHREGFRRLNTPPRIAWADS